MPGNKTIVITGSGRPIPWKLEDLDIPVAGPGSLVVKVLFAPLVDYHKVSTSMR
jgi:hypothetical protein